MGNNASDTDEAPTSSVNFADLRWADWPEVKAICRKKPQVLKLELVVERFAREHNMDALKWLVEHHAVVSVKAFRSACERMDATTLPLLKFLAAHGPVAAAVNGDRKTEPL